MQTGEAEVEKESDLGKLRLFFGSGVHRYMCAQTRETKYGLLQALQSPEKSN